MLDVFNYLIENEDFTFINPGIFFQTFNKMFNKFLSYILDRNFDKYISIQIRLLINIVLNGVRRKGKVSIEVYLIPISSAHNLME